MIKLGNSEDNFLTMYLEHLSVCESPEIFNLWSGLYAVGAMLGRRCYIDMGITTFFPNLFVVFLGDAGTRKSTAINVMRRLLFKCEPKPNILADKTTPEALIDGLRVMDMIGDKVIAREKHEGVVIASELAGFLNKASYEGGFGPLLTDLFDCPEVYEYRTKGGGRQQLSNVFFALIGAATTEFMMMTIPESAIGSGFTSRCVFVLCKADEAEPVPIPSIDKKRETVLVHRLQQMSLLGGNYRFTKESIECYETAYRNWFHNSPFKKDKYLAGYSRRRYGHVMKLAMILCAADSHELLIKPWHLETADELLKQVEIHMPEVMRMITATEQGSMVQWVLGLIQGGCKYRSALIQVTSNKMTAPELDILLDTLCASKQIRALQIPGDTVYNVREGEKKTEPPLVE